MDSVFLLSMLRLDYDVSIDCGAAMATPLGNPGSVVSIKYIPI